MCDVVLPQPAVDLINSCLGLLYWHRRKQLTSTHLVLDYLDSNYYHHMQQMHAWNSWRLNTCKNEQVREMVSYHIAHPPCMPTRFNNIRWHLLEGRLFHRAHLFPSTNVWFYQLHRGRDDIKSKLIKEATALRKLVHHF